MNVKHTAVTIGLMLLVLAIVTRIPGAKPVVINTSAA